MEWSLKTVVVAMLLLVFFVVVIMLVTGWSGQSNEAFIGVMNFLNGLGGGKIGK